MGQILVLSLFTVYELSLGLPPLGQQQPPAGQAWGAFGQFCPIPVTGQVQCETGLDIASPGTADPGFLDCSRPNDCCLCKSMECGDATNPCHTVVIGKNAAFGVRSINVIGDPTLGGVNLECMGSTSCAYTYVTGNAMGEAACNGEYACYQAVMKIENPVTGFGVECVGTGACDGLQMELFFPKPTLPCDPATSKDILLGGVECMSGSCNNLAFVVNNQGCDNVKIEGVHCPDGACNGARFGFLGNVNIDYCQLPATGPQPFGLDNCFANLMELACQGKECQNQIRTLVDPLNNFELVCEGPSACLNARYTVELSGKPAQPPTNIRFVCATRDACQNAKFLVDNFGIEPVTVNVECIGAGSCDEATFSGTPGTTIEVLCENPSHCNGCTYNGIACDATATVPKPQPPNGPVVVRPVV